MVSVLSQELAFMKYPEFQTYLNLEKIINVFQNDPNRAITAISKHEVGHRFCPFDLITSIILKHKIIKGLEDYKNNRFHTSSDVFNEIENIIENSERS